MQDFRNLLRRSSPHFFYNLKSESHPDVGLSIQANSIGIYCCPKTSDPDPYIYTHFEVCVIRSGVPQLDELFEYSPVDVVQGMFEKHLL